MAEPSHEATLQSRSGRRIKLTDEARALQVEQKQKNYRQLELKLKRGGNAIIEAGEDASSASQKLQTIAKWKHDYIAFVQLDTELLALLQEEEKKEHSVCHEARLGDINVLKGKVETLQKSLEELMTVEKDGSAVGGDAESRISRRSSSSSAVRAQLQIMRLQDEHRKAEVLAKLAALKKKQDLEKRKQELQRQEEEFELQLQLSIQEQQDQVLKKIEEDLGHAHRTVAQNQPVSALQAPKVIPPSSLAIPPIQPPHIQPEVQSHPLSEAYPNPERQCFTEEQSRRSDYQPERELPVDRQHSVENEQPTGFMANNASGERGYAAGCFDTVRIVHALPALEPETFSGDIEQFSFWRKSFESYIEARTSSPVERLYFLAQYTTGEARDAIRGFLLLRTSDAYSKAKQKLIDRYGNDFITTATYRRRLRDWPVIKPGDGKGLRQLADFLEGCEAAAEEVVGLKVLGNADENNQILQKLPRYIVERWKRVVDASIYEPKPGCPAGYPSFSKFVTFLSAEARIACGPVSVEVEQSYSAKSSKGTKVQTFATNVTKQSVLRCRVCKNGEHAVKECEVFQGMNISEKRDSVMAYGLCRGCLKPGHLWRECKRRDKCEKCDRWHPSIMHDHSYVTSETAVKSVEVETATTLQVNTSGSQQHCSHTMIVPVRLGRAGYPEHQKVVYALLDPQSDACFVSPTVSDDIRAQSEEVMLELNTVTGKMTIASHAFKDLIMWPLEGDSTEIKLPTTYSREIPADRHLIPRAETARQYTHLEDIADKILPYMKDVEIGLLIGTSCGRAIKPREVRPGNDDDPWGVRTTLGWGIVGPVCNPDESGDSNSVTCKYVQTSKDQHKVCHFAFRTQVQEISPTQVIKMFEQDFNETTGKEYSAEDRLFLQKMSDGIHRTEEERFEMPLPLKKSDTTLPNNKSMALQRLKGLKAKLVRNDVYRRDYIASMQTSISKGYAEPVPAEELHLKDGRVWYIPHHGIYHPQKPGKLRIVFDCSAEFKGRVLNNCLLQGPDMVNSLPGILCRFRLAPIAFTCDIEAMFNQVGVNKEDRNFLRFFWWKNGDVQHEPEEYRMTTHLFGATSSPACAMSALRATADAHENEYGKEAADFVRNEFYIDDGLKSVSSPDEAICLIEATRSMCQQGGFHIHKRLSNSVEVIKSVPAECRCSGLQSLDMGTSELPVQRTLGIEWNAESDNFQYSVKPVTKPPTRRGILSTVSSIFDPLGYISPFILVGKQILKDLCQDGYGWDDEVPGEILSRWNEWITDLSCLNMLHIPRCLTTPEFGSVKVIELHHFSDASTSGYGQCSYIRQVDDNDQVSSRLIMSKARVTPSKPVTVPRLELTAAVMSVKISSFLRKELGLVDVKEFFWTDSMVVLGYISNEARRFHVFVANRVQQIAEHTKPNQWRYIDTKSNPADLASRGVKAEELLNCSLWWNGPDFLNHHTPLPEQHVERTPQPEDPEVNKLSHAMTTVFCTNTTQKVEYVGLLERLEYFSSWHRAKKAVALCLRYRDILLKRTKSKDYQSPSVEEMTRAENVILKTVQAGAFREELHALSQESEKSQRTADDNDSGRVKNVKKTSCIYRLDPFLNRERLICIGGRIGPADMTAEQLYPVVLPRSGHVTNLIIRECHEGTCHSGRGTTLGEIRSSGYWVLRGRGAAAKYILNCVKCKKLRGQTCGQKMANLPSERVHPSA